MPNTRFVGAVAQHPAGSQAERWMLLELLNLSSVRHYLCWPQLTCILRTCLEWNSPELDTARKTLRKANEGNPDEPEKERIESALKQSKYALLKPEENLTETQKRKLEELREVVPLLAQIHQQKEAFRAIFEQAKDWGDGTFKLLDWLVDAQEAFQESVGTICRWFREVTAYFDHRTTSGVVEGINNKLKLIKRSGYGFRNFDNFQLRCLICWHLVVSWA